MSDIPSIPKTYEPQESEARWYKFWLERDYFHASEKSGSSDRPSFAIVMPPPNVTSELHIGTATDMTFQDILVRWKRMQGYETLWMPGTDHAGIATNWVVERKLAEEGKNRHQLGREKFLERVWQWVELTRNTIIGQLKALGCSCDWQRLRFTMDEGLSKAVKEAFVRLYNDGLIYKAKKIVNWCPRCQTTLSDLENVHKETQGHLYYIKYPLPLGETEEFLVIATTRPETMLGDTAVAVHPEDERYKDRVGKFAILPIVNRKLPIVADSYVSMEFAQGALKVTPAHDPNDFEIGLRHNLPQLNVMNSDGSMNENAGKYRGMDRRACRKALLNDLKEAGYLLKIENLTHAVGYCQRCDTITEPYLSAQWFMRMNELADKAIEASQKEEVKFLPERWTKVFYDWMYDIRDWPISRQIWWGHQLPVWYCDDCSHINVATQTPKNCGKCGSSHLSQEADVLDTWFSSGLWPFSTMGWPDDTELLRKFYPTTVLVTAWDIIFFWVARMIMSGLKFMEEVPFKTVFLHPLVADETGKKMSKSRGNIIDPLPTMEKYGTDAFRFAIASCLIPSTYMQLPEKRIEGYRNFTNKLWNASRFLIMNLNGFKKMEEKELKPTLADRWIRSRYHSLISEATLALEEFRFNDAAAKLYDFVWHEYCDWYVELAKVRFYRADDLKLKQTAQFVAWEVLEGTLRLLHPFMPFITEEVWQHLPHEAESITIAPWPKSEHRLNDIQAETEMGFLMDLIKGIRNIRSEMNLPPSSEVKVLIQAESDSAQKLINRHMEYVQFLSKASEVLIASKQEKPKLAATAIVRDVEIYVPLAGLIDIDKERLRLRKEFDRAKSELERVKKTLQSENFLNKAPEDIVKKEKEKEAELGAKKAGLERNLQSLEG